MKKVRNIDSIFGLVKGLSEVEQAALAGRIMEMLVKPDVSKRNDICRELVAGKTTEKPDCPHCAAKASLGCIVKKGLNKGTQRFYCKSCGRYFVSTTNTALAYTRKDAETWRKFIRLTIAGKSLNYCETECHISHLTAFTWRHKILNAFAVNQEKTMMRGRVEVDEMLIPISYKGNHIKGKFGKRVRKAGEDNGLPRKSYKRGSDNRSKFPREKACVFCMVENGNKGFFAAVPGRGFMTDDMLDATMARHVDKNSAMMLADDYKGTKKYFERNNYKYMILKSNTSENPHGHKPEVIDGMHLQHVNAMHHHLRDFLRPYCGVSTKYLSNYISLFIWLKSLGVMKKTKSANTVSMARVTTPDCYVSRKVLDSRPAVPQCA